MLCSTERMGIWWGARVSALLEAAIVACAARLDAPRNVGAMDIQKKCKPCACARCGLCAAEGGG